MNYSPKHFTCLNDLKDLKLQDAKVALEQTPKNVGRLPSKQIWLTGRRRCYRTASWQCENGPLWLGGCWAAGTGGRCAWIWVAVIIIGEGREIHRQRISSCHLNAQWNIHELMYEWCQASSPCSEAAWRYVICCWKWSCREAETWWWYNCFISQNKITPS